jgi:hypothetical protein
MSCPGNKTTDAGVAHEPQPFWTPSEELLENAAVARLAREVGTDDYEALWRWSVEDIGQDPEVFGWFVNYASQRRTEGMVTP